MHASGVPVWSHDGILQADETGLLILYDQNIVRTNNSWQPDRPLRNPGQPSLSVFADYAR